jgi:hypothetical protein
LVWIKPDAKQLLCVECEEEGIEPLPLNPTERMREQLLDRADVLWDQVVIPHVDQDTTEKGLLRWFLSPRRTFWEHLLDIP